MIVGLTEDKRIVLGGLGKLYFQEGIPLSVIFDNCQKWNFVPSFNHLYDDLKGNGMKHERIIHLLNEQLFESYGKEYRDEVLKRLKNRNS